MLILGIDPGTATTGWGVLKVDGANGRTKFIARNFGIIVTDKEREAQYRLLSLKEGISKLIAEYKPDVMSVEQIFFGVNHRTAIAVGQAIGAIYLAAAEKHLPIFGYTGLTMKLMVGGSGRADKEQVQKGVLKFLGVRKLPSVKSQAGKEYFRFRDDAFDALALALCHHFKTAGLDTGAKIKPK
ncbi:MAG: crossover junction endodeoxyribonuclease RuvC [bacterium]|nr:crossover junction endodeoxyribonuclease RuvC [bacterium]